MKGLGALRPGEKVVVRRAAPRAQFSRFWKAKENASSIWNGHDTIACPTFAQVIHRNTSMRKVACLLQVDDGPLQSKLGFYEEEPLLGA